MAMEDAELYINTVVYTRVSTQEQAENNKSLDMQERACRDYAARKNIDVIKVFVEEGESAKTADRTKLQEMLRYCADKKNAVRHVIVWKLDRLARKTEDHLTLTSMFAKYGARLHSATEPIEDTPSGKLMEHILASFAEFDNSVRSERSRKGMEGRLAEGGWVHIAPIGYKNAKDVLGRPTLAPDEQADAVVKVLNLFSKGLHTQKHLAEIARKKYKLQSKNGNHISDNAVYKMLRNPVYAGKVYGKSLPEPIDGLHEGLVSYETFLKNQAILEGRNPTKGPKNPDKKGRWSLRQFLRCRYCGRGLTGSTPTGRSASYAYYHCTHCKGVKITGGKRKGEAKHLSLNKGKVDESFQELFQGFEPPAEVLKLFREIVLRKWNNEFKDSIEARVRKEKELAALDRRKSEYIDMRADGELEADELQEKKNQIAIHRQKLKIELSELTSVFQKKEEAVDAAIDFMANAKRIWSIASSEDRSRFQTMVIPAGITVNERFEFGTASLGPTFKEAHLLAEELEATKKTQKSSESIVVTLPGIEPGLLD